MNKLMIYGATGYTGRMAAEQAEALGLDVVIAGRNGERLESLAAQLDVPYRVFTPDDQAAESLEGIGVLLNFAGPFAQTADALMQACIVFAACCGLFAQPCSRWRKSRRQISRVNPLPSAEPVYVTSTGCHRGRRGLRTSDMDTGEIHLRLSASPSSLGSVDPLQRSSIRIHNVNGTFQYSRFWLEPE